MKDMMRSHDIHRTLQRHHATSLKLATNTNPGDRELRSRGVGSALRDIDDLDRWATAVGLVRVADIAMPANNLTLIYEHAQAGG